MTALADTRPSPEDEQGSHGPLRRALARLHPTPARIVLVAAFACWLASLRSLGGAPVSQYGLLASASPLFVVSIALTGVGFVMVVRASDFIGGWMAIGLSIATFRLSITLATGAPFYSWTYKHIAVADYIQQTGASARDVDIYQHWNGLFAATAWLSEVSGISTLTIAHWFTPSVYVIAALIVYAVARVWQCPPMVAVIVTFLVQSLDWIGQSYYSPQCTAYLLALGVLGLFGWGLRTGRTSKSAIWLIVCLFVAITVTHQLTPYWLVLLAFLLTITRRLRPWWLFLVLAAIALGFLAYNWSAAAHFGILQAGDPVSNARRNVPLPRVGGWLFTSQVERALSATFWLGAAVCGVSAAVRRRPFLVHTLLAFSSFGILLGQSYGGEAVFRVFLFSLPGCAMLLAPVIERLAKMKLTYLPLLVIVTAAVVASAQGLFGIWSADKMPRSEVDLSRKLMLETKVPTYITAVAPVWPERNSAKYVDFARWNQSFDTTMVYAANLVGSHFNTDTEYQKLMDVLTGSHGATPTYLVVTQQMRIYDWYYGILPWDSLPNLESRINQDPRWTQYYTSKSLHIYRFVGGA